MASAVTGRRVLACSARLRDRVKGFQYLDCEGGGELGAVVTIQLDGSF